MLSFLWLLYAPEFQCTPRARIILKFLHWEMSEYYVTAVTI